MQKTYLFIMILCIIAIGNAGYLSYEAYQMIHNTNPLAVFSSPCDISETLSCTNVLTDKRTWILGIPFPYIALVVYPVLLLLALVGYLRQSLTSMKVILAMSLGGMCFNGYIIYQEALYIHAFCPLCLMCTAIIVTIFVMSLMIIRKKQ